MDRVILQLYRDTGLPDGEDHTPLRSLVSTQYRSVTDRRTDGFTVAYAALVKLALRSAVIKPALHRVHAAMENQIELDGKRSMRAV